jgi:hypothetical protein
VTWIQGSGLAPTVVAEPGVEVRVQDLGDLSATTVDEVRGLAVRQGGEVTVAPPWLWVAGGRCRRGGAIEGVEEEEDSGGERKPCWKKKE